MFSLRSDNVPVSGGFYHYVAVAGLNAKPNVRPLAAYGRRSALMRSVLVIYDTVDRGTTPLHVSNASASHQSPARSTISPPSLQETTQLRPPLGHSFPPLWW